MTVNLSRRTRIAIYVANVLGTPVVAYAHARGWIGDLEVGLWSTEVAAAFVLAGLNAPSGVTAPDSSVVVVSAANDADPAEIKQALQRAARRPE